MAELHHASGHLRQRGDARAIAADTEHRDHDQRQRGQQAQHLHLRWGHVQCWARRGPRSARCRRAGSVRRRRLLRARAGRIELLRLSSRFDTRLIVFLYSDDVCQALSRTYGHCPAPLQATPRGTPNCVRSSHRSPQRPPRCPCCPTSSILAAPMYSRSSSPIS